MCLQIFSRKVLSKELSSCLGVHQFNGKMFWQLDKTAQRWCPPSRGVGWYYSSWWLLGNFLRWSRNFHRFSSNHAYQFHPKTGVSLKSLQCPHCIRVVLSLFQLFTLLAVFVRYTIKFSRVFILLIRFNFSQWGMLLIVIVIQLYSSCQLYLFQF